MRTTPPTLNELRAQRTEALTRRSPGELARIGVDLGAIAAARAAEIVGNRPTDGLDQIKNPETQAAFEAAFALTEQIYATSHITDPENPAYKPPTDLVPPTPEEFAGQYPGVFSLLGELHEQMEREGKQPEILITPHLGRQQTKALFAAKTRDTTILGNPLKKQVDGDGLWVNDAITDEIWQQCDIPQRDQATITMPDGMMWSITITSGKQIPDNLNESHQELTSTGTPLLTISQYVRLQLGRIQTSEPPVDADHASWLQNEAGAASAPYGYWDSDFGQVSVRCHGVGYSHGLLGSRSPVGQVLKP